MLAGFFCAQVLGLHLGWQCLPLVSIPVFYSMRFFNFFLFFSLLFIVAAYAKSPTVEKATIRVDGRERQYLTFVPESLVEEAPLVFVLHGYGGTAEGMIEFTKMNEIAERNGFAVCYPQAFLGPDDKHSWNAGYSNPEVDDVNFIEQLAQTLIKRHKLSPVNVFVTGMSNGADMSYVLACERPELVRAIAPVAGCMMESTFERCQNSEPVPVFEIHGIADEITLYNGDPDYSDEYGGYIGVPEILEFWREKNGCSDVKIDTLSDKDANDGSFVIREIATTSVNENEVWLYKLVGGGHDWPGSWGNKDFVAAKEIWHFFNMFVTN